MGKRLKSLSIVLPAFNEADNIEKTVKAAVYAAQKYSENFEIIVVNDGSKDSTEAIVRSLMGSIHELRLLSHKANIGYGGAVGNGLRAAKKAWVLIMDSDGQFDPDDLKYLLPATSRVDAVLGYRIGRKDHIGRSINARAWSTLIRFKTGLKVKDLDCAFKLIKRDFLQKVLPLRSTGAVVSAELLYRLKKNGAKWEEVGVRHLPRIYGESSGAKWSVIIKAFKELSLLK